MPPARLDRMQDGRPQTPSHRGNHHSDSQTLTAVHDAGDRTKHQRAHHLHADHEAPETRRRSIPIATASRPAGPASFVLRIGPRFDAATSTSASPPLGPAMRSKRDSAVRSDVSAGVEPQPPSQSARRRSLVQSGQVRVAARKEVSASTIPKQLCCMRPACRRPQRSIAPASRPDRQR